MSSVRSPNYISDEEEQKLHKMEWEQEHGPSYQRAENHFGLPYCPLCGCKLQTKKSRSRSLTFRVKCSNNHWFELSFEGRFKVFKQIAKQDQGVYQSDIKEDIKAQYYCESRSIALFR